MIWTTVLENFLFMCLGWAGTSVLGHFFLLGGTSSILRIFLGGTSKKKHPVDLTIMIFRRSDQHVQCTFYTFVYGQSTKGHPQEITWRTLQARPSPSLNGGEWRTFSGLVNMKIISIIHFFDRLNFFGSSFEQIYRWIQMRFCSDQRTISYRLVLSES